MTYEYDRADDDWENTVRRDISMVGRNIRPAKQVKPVLSAGNASQVVALEKKSLQEITALKKILDKHIVFAKELHPTVSHLADMLHDAEARLEADTIDDVYGIQDMKLEFKKLAASISKFIPKEEQKIDTQGNRITDTAAALLQSRSDHVEREEAYASWGNN